MGDKEILVNVHQAYRWVVAVCDRRLKGRILLEGKRKLDLSGPFFDGTEMDEKEVMGEIERCTNEDATFNIVGEKSIGVAKKAGLVGDEGIMEIEGIPYALALL